MVHVPAGALIVGTPPEQLPRVPDQEMPGSQSEMGEFFIDRFAYPNEEGAIPTTGVDQAEAARSCERQGKRLCTELEWERACKGPGNTTYEYGDLYRPELCATGSGTRLAPSGYRIGCVSKFGVRDMHGSVWEWTSSAWDRGTKGDAVAVRGGNSPEGELVGRCANARRVKPTEASGEIGFRCCKGTVNPARVELTVERGPALRRRGAVPRKLASLLEASLPADVAELMRSRGVFRILRMWDWRPVGNERLLVAAGCAGVDWRRACGVLLVRSSAAKSEVLAWAPSGVYVPTVQVGGNPRDLWVYGGDAKSHYRRLVRYAWGLVEVLHVERNVRPRKVPSK